MSSESVGRDTESEAEVDMIKRMIDSIRPSFAGSNIDQETLEKLEMLWIKKLKLLDEGDHGQDKKDQDSGLQQDSKLGDNNSG